MQRGSLKVWKNPRGIKMWRGQWRENGRGRTRLFGRYADVTRSDALEALNRELEALGARGDSRETSPTTLQAFIEREYLPVKSKVWKRSTRETTEQIIRTHIIDTIGRRQISAITRRELQALLDSKAAAGLSSSVVGHVRWQLAAILEMAAADGLILRNPTKGLQMPTCQGTVDKRTIGASDIIRGQMVLEIRERLVFRLGVCEGMRPGEITALKVGDFHDDGMFHVVRRVYRGAIDTPKTRDSVRLIPPTPITLALLKTWIDMTGAKPGDWLFPSERGTPLSYSNVWRRNIQPWLAKVNLGSTNFQVLRRSWVTLLPEVEKDPKIRAQLAGHSVDVSENEYRQPNAEALRRTMSKLGERLQ